MTLLRRRSELPVRTHLDLLNSGIGGTNVADY
jgi:hypothetical protein